MKRFLRSATLLLSCLGMTVGAALPSYGQGDTKGMGLTGPSLMLLQKGLEDKEGAFFVTSVFATCVGYYEAMGNYALDDLGDAKTADQMMRLANGARLAAAFFWLDHTTSAPIAIEGLAEWAKISHGANMARNGFSPEKRHPALERAQGVCRSVLPLQQMVAPMVVEKVRRKGE